MPETDLAGERSFPTSAGILLGLGLGGFFDGIVLHQLLQWHHMLSSRYPGTSIENLKLNTLWDGLFHAAAYAFVVAGVFILWRRADRVRLRWSSRMLAGSMLLGWGLFNIAEGLVNHHLLAVHHVNEIVDPAARIYWDVAFLIWGVAMLVPGFFLLRAGRPA